MMPVPEMLAAAATLRHPSGRFWESDSDVEGDDLGIAVEHRPVEPSSPDFKRALPEVAAPPQIRRSPARPASTPPHQPPWRNLWKGPLPPARVSPARTLADFFPLAFSAAGAVFAAARSPGVEEGAAHREAAARCLGRQWRRVRPTTWARFLATRTAGRTTGGFGPRTRYCLLSGLVRGPRCFL
jgi:hypothetical protein